MRQLLGEYECKIDAKGRMRIPSGLLGQFEGAEISFVINRGFEINGLNQYDKRNRELVRYFYRGAQKLVLDAADRVLVSKRLLEYAEVKKDVILAAVNDRIELWAKDKYDNMLDEEPMDFSDLAQSVLGNKMQGGL